MGGLRALRLSCTVQHYEWGRIGEESEVGRLHSLMNKTEIQQKPYAELWIGTHDSGHSLVMLDNQVMRLKDWLQQHPEALGDRVVNIWGIDLPFLFKVLSVAKALSIQAHPDKELAKMLHDLHPNVYKDGNHKPEMALALTEFEALCGFVSAEGLPEILQGIPLNPFTKRYSPPFSEFEVDRCMLPSGQRVTFPEIPGPSVFLILDGEGVMVQEFNKEELISSLGRGDVFFVPAGIQLTISAVIEANEDAEKTSNPLHLYRAGVNSCVFEG